MPGKLYVVATPIGNLKDITFRAIEVLKTADFIACEDTRRSKILLDTYAIQRPLVSFFEGNEKRKAGEIIERLSSGENAALISDAGTPLVSDPGYRLVSEAVEKGIEVLSVPGPSAFLAALSVSGLATHAFIFEGFLPQKSAARVKKIRSWEGETRTIIFYESTHRVLRVLSELKDVFGEIPVVVARELTKKFEEVLRGTPGEILKRLEAGSSKGEFVVLLNPGAAL